MSEGLATLTNEQMARILHAKAAELENYVKPRLGRPGLTGVDWLVADVALIAGLMAEFITRMENSDG